MNFQTVSGVSIPRYRKGHSGMKLAAIKAEPILRAEYESEAKLDGQSMGLQSCKLATNALYLAQWDYAAKLMVEEHTDSLVQFGITRMSPFISLTMF